VFAIAAGTCGILLVYLSCRQPPAKAAIGEQAFFWGVLLLIVGIVGNYQIVFTVIHGITDLIFCAATRKSEDID